MASNNGTTLEQVNQSLEEMRQGQNPAINIPLLFTNLVFYPFYGLDEVGTSIEELRMFDYSYRDGTVDPPFSPSYANGTFQDALNALEACRAGIVTDGTWGILVKYLSYDSDHFDRPPATYAKLETTKDEFVSIGRAYTLSSVRQTLDQARQSDPRLQSWWFQSILKSAMEKSISLEEMGTTQPELDQLRDKVSAQSKRLSGMDY